jgi:hypothetical protein
MLFADPQFISLLLREIEIKLNVNVLSKYCACARREDNYASEKPQY